jgi:hypothetical protein
VPATKSETPARGRSYQRVKAEHRYPVYDLEDSIALARAVRDKGGGAVSAHQLAGFLDYSGTNNGAFIRRLAAARYFGLIQDSGKLVSVTRLANTILAPERPGEDDRRARVEAFLKVPLFKALYERYKTGSLPPEAGLRNAFETQFELPRAQTQRAYRAFIDSARQAGFFDARGGSPTHLVIPVILPAMPESANEDGDDAEEDEPRAPGVPSQPSQNQAGGSDLDVIRRLRLVLVEKVREIPADNLDMIREYIAEIKELDKLENDKG